MADAEYDAVIVGAGLTGLVTALLLARSGMRVAVLEARTVGAVTTGHTTAKLSLLQGSVLSGIRQHNSHEVLRAYVDGNREGQAWMLRYLDERGVDYQRRDAYTYANTADGRARLEEEQAVGHAAGLATELTEDVALPFETRGALLLRDQAQFNPMHVLAALVDDVRRHGGVIIEGARVHDVDASDPAIVTTQRGSVRAAQVILATGTPILDRGLYFAKLIPSRSYVSAYRVPGAPEAIPQGMYLSIDSPSRSLRTVPVGAEELLLVGGNGHPVGRNPHTAQSVDDLDIWTRAQFPGAQRTHSWSAQDYQSVNMVPFVGWFPRGRGRIFVATGYNKWGMTNATAAALSLSGEILGGRMAWADVLHHRVSRPASFLTAAKAGAEVAAWAAKRWADAETTGEDLFEVRADAPAEGRGRVTHEGLRPVGVSTVDGVTCAVSAVCTHLRGVLGWNETERSWDCPLHGSRFAADGTLLEGPATEDLAVID
nr:FAD-dependent oxidoreductase [Microbacterium sp. STN6]